MTGWASKREPPGRIRAALRRLLSSDRVPNDHRGRATKMNDRVAFVETGFSKRSCSRNMLERQSIRSKRLRA